jgi:uncharacterized protein
LHYRGDILTIYAVLGIALLLCYKLPDKILLVVALLLVFNVPSVVTRAVGAMNEAPNPFDMMSQDQAGLEKYYNTVKSGSYPEILKANFHEFNSKFVFQVQSGRIYITTGLFLLGLYAGRKRIFENVTFFKNLIRFSLWTILGSILFLLVFFGITQLAGIVLPQSVQWLIGGEMWDIISTMLAAIYVGLVVTLMQKDRWRKRLMHFYSAGRMGLTTYLSQTLIGIFIFFSVGFGLLGEIGSAACMAISIIVFIGQISFSNYWLRHFLYGPVEWLWRSMTYLKVQPFRNPKDRDEEARLPREPVGQG